MGGREKCSHAISAGDPVAEKVGAALNFCAEGGEDGTPMEKLPETPMEKLPKTGTDLCHQCGRFLQKGHAIPSCMMDLHVALCHAHNEDKSDKNKKVKREQENMMLVQNKLMTTPPLQCVRLHAHHFACLLGFKPPQPPSLKMIHPTARSGASRRHRLQATVAS